MRKRLAAAALLAVVVVSVAGPGSAASLRAGLCSFTGTTTFTNPVTTALVANEYVFTGSIQCAGDAGTNMPEPGLAAEEFAGEVAILGDGNVACQLSNTRGTVTATIPTGDGTRDVWSALVSIVGTFESVVFGSIQVIDHEVFDEESGEWVAVSSDSPGVNLLAGAATIAVGDGDLDACQAGGISTRDVSGTVAYAFTV